jgi:hypothetical protein
MKFGELNRIFDPDCGLTDRMSKLIEEDNEEGRNMRSLVNHFIETHLKVEPTEAIKLESAINGLLVLTGEAYIALGFILGQGCEITDEEALEEVNELNRKIKEGGFLPFWTKNNNGCHPSRKIEAAAIR